MCGILGGSETEWDYEAALESMRYRGPDGLRVKKGKEFSLGFVRLSIMDLSDNGMQPMESDDGKVTIVFNGEIYGFKRLKNELIRKGYIFKSGSDTEIILNSYLEYGDDFIYKIDGMFAIAIYDQKRGVVKLYRDRVGIKPLYYYWDGKHFAFGSELEPIKVLLNNMKLNIDYTALYDYLTYTYIPEPKSMYKNLYKLEPGKTITYYVKNRKLSRPKEYWVLTPNDTVAGKRKKEDIEESIRELITESVEEQMVADVPVGSFLSGGIDSSIVTYESLKYNTNIETFSMGFTNKQFDELGYARLMADKFNIRRNEQILDRKMFNGLYPKLKEWYDEPFSDTSAFPTYLVSKLAKEKVTVVLTGDGGDEIFGGYYRYEQFLNGKGNGRINNRILSGFIEQHLYDNSVVGDTRLLEPVSAICPLYEYLQKGDKRKYAEKWGIPKDYDDYWYFRKHYHKELPPITRLQYLDFKTYLPSDVLTKVDRASMQVSLEARVPLLSKKVIEYAFSLSQEDRNPDHVLKGSLKNAYKGLIPDQILFRKKMGFSIPDEYMRKKVSRQEELLKTVWKLL
ncbi:MAG: asparagine synthase (glutamine-hydrolyzing) [Lachnospiraceae bacterium]|nr:asparagine synthase (glutamine-hydrolyzing) [Lachnospiraceae bacterium]